jgi:hypothetical protein
MEGIRAGKSGHGSKYDFNPGTPGHPELSYGPFQLNRLSGLGVEFEKETADIRKRIGLGNLTDPRTIQLQAYWVANYLKTHNTSPWMGFHGRRDADPRWGEAGYDPRKVPGYVAAAGIKPIAAITGTGDPSKHSNGLSDPINPSFLPNWNKVSKEGPFAPGPVSMNNMSHFQQDKKLALTIHNPAGANYAVSAGMLGSGSGSYT